MTLITCSAPSTASEKARPSVPRDHEPAHKPYPAGHRRPYRAPGTGSNENLEFSSGELSEREVQRMMTLEIRHELKRSPYSPVAGFSGPIPYPKGF